MTFEEFKKVFQNENFTERYFYGDPAIIAKGDGFCSWVLFDNKTSHKYEVYKTDGRGSYGLYKSFTSAEDAYDYIISVFRVLTKINKNL